MNKIINILKKKPIPLDKFINLALYGNNFGYYIKKNPFGEKGDFITSPLISKLFGEMIAIWCVSFWEYLGKPKKILVVELGPGDGSLCKDLINTFKNFTDFYKSVEIKLLEISPKLKKIQKNKIKDKKVKWIKKINECDYGPIIFVGNEFFDSLPIKQIYRKKNSFFERYVSRDKKNNKIKFVFKKAKKSLIKNMKNLDLTRSNKIIEYPVNAIEYLKVISKKIKKYNGTLLTFDYGYIERKNKDTLQSVKNHKYSNIFSNISGADITHHINFKLFCDILSKNNMKVEKIVTQSEFLQKLGIIERANILSKKISFKDKANMFYRLKKLLNYSEMGKLFKVLCAQKNGSKFSLGF